MRKVFLSYTPDVELIRDWISPSLTDVFPVPGEKDVAPLFTHPAVVMVSIHYALATSYASPLRLF